MQGRKVRFVPGWDCHGLPIELKGKRDKNQVRQAERKFERVCEKYESRERELEKGRRYMKVEKESWRREEGI